VRVGRDAFLDARRQDPDDDLAVDRVGNPDRRPRRDEAQVAHVADVVVIRLDRENVTREDRAEDPLHTGLGEPGSQRVQMRRPGEDQPFLGLLQVVDRDRLRGGDREFLDDLAGQRVDKPRLAAGQLEGVFRGAWRERLPGVGSVLSVEHGHVVQGEVSQPQ
jgi:hypothetical protein